MGRQTLLEIWNYWSSWGVTDGAASVVKQNCEGISAYQPRLKKQNWVQYWESPCCFCTYRLYRHLRGCLIMICIWIGLAGHLSTYDNVAHFYDIESCQFWALSRTCLIYKHIGMGTGNDTVAKVGRRLWRNITVEPVVVLFTVILALSGIPGEELYLMKACKEGPTVSKL